MRLGKFAADWRERTNGHCPSHSIRPRTVRVGDPEPVAIVLKVPDGKRPAHFLDQPAQQGEQAVIGIADRLELIAGGVPVPKLEGIQSDTASKQPCPEMEVVRFACAVGDPDGFEADVLEIVQTAQLGHLGVDAPGAKLPVSLVLGAVVDAIVAGHDLPASLAMKWLHVDYPICRPRRRLGRLRRVARRLKRSELYYVKPPGFVGKVRPAVVVQADRFNDDPPSATVCLLTSHLVESKLRVRIEPTPASGLEKSSQVMIDKVMTLPLDRFDNSIGSVSKAEIDAIAGSLRTWLDL